MTCHKSFQNETIFLFGKILYKISASVIFNFTGWKLDYDKGIDVLDANMVCGTAIENIKSIFIDAKPEKNIVKVTQNRKLYVKV